MINHCRFDRLRSYMPINETFFVRLMKRFIIKSKNLCGYRFKKKKDIKIDKDCQRYKFSNFLVRFEWLIPETLYSLRN